MNDEYTAHDKLGTLTIKGSLYGASLITNEYSKDISRLIKKIYKIKKVKT